MIRRLGRRDRVRRLSAGLSIVVAGAAGLARGAPEVYASAEAVSATSVAIDGTDFLINGEITNKGRTHVELESGGTANLEGLLPNARMINAVFDDDNESTRSNWMYPSGPAEDWNPDRHTAEFVAMLPTYREKGLLMVTVGLQGGNPASASAPGNGSRPSWVVSAFNADGSLKQAWMERLATAIEAADAEGIVVNVSLFYQRQEHLFTNEAAVKAAVDNATDWLVAQGYTNVIVGIQNEVGSSLWGPGIWQPDRAHELIERAKGRHPSLIVGTGMRDVIPSEEIVKASDYVAFSANSMSAAETGAFIDDLRRLPSWQAEPKPILVIEDGPRPSADEIDAALARHVSFGYHDDGPAGGAFSNYEDGFQWVPANWTINTSAKQAFFDRVAALTGGCAPPDTAPGYELLVSSSPQRTSPAPLAGERVAGDTYVFLAGDSTVSEVRFFFDDPDMSGGPRHVESKEPYDFAGTASDASALTFDTTTVADGSHDITALVVRSDGSSEVVSATFTVANGSPALVFSPDSLSFTVEEGAGASEQTSELEATDGSAAAYTASADTPCVRVRPASGSTPETLTVSVDAGALAPGTYTANVTAAAAGYVGDALTVTLTITEASPSGYELRVSTSPNRTGSVPLSGETVSGDIYVFLAPEERVTGVRFWLDDPAMTGTPVRIEQNAPWDFGGGDAELAKPFDTRDVAAGDHTITAEYDLEGAATEVVSAAFTVAK